MSFALVLLTAVSCLSGCGKSKEKQYDAALPYLQEHRLEPWTHNKAIQKAIESYRITDEQKAYLRSLKVKLPKQS